MPIVLGCPGCGKRYEVDSALAGKKSRCKQCGEVFQIPAESASESSADRSREAAGQRSADTSRTASSPVGSASTWESVLAEDSSGLADPI
jgi:predicted Zn finger-like uncharacterized protein